MKFQQHYSSSKGNLYEVTAENGARLLIEAGVPWEKLQEALKYDLKGIEGCLLSHYHNDHCKAFKKVMQQGVNVYSSLGTWEALSRYEGEYKHWRKANVLGDGIFHVGSFNVLPFEVQHDVPCLGFVIREKATDEYLLFVTDFFCLEQDWTELYQEDTGQHKKGEPIWPFSIVALACSYDTEILQRLVDDQAIDEALAKRLLFSHPSKQWLLNYLRNHVNLSKCREIHLLHCSAGNLDREATCKEFESELFIEVL